MRATRYNNLQVKLSFEDWFHLTEEYVYIKRTQVNPGIAGCPGVYVIFRTDLRLRILSVLHAISFFGSFCVIETVYRTDKITGDTADSLKTEMIFSFIFGAAAARTMIADDAVVAAGRVAIDRVIDRTITDALFAHKTDDLLECFKIRGSVTIHLDIRDVTGIGEGVIGGLETDLIENRRVVVHRDMEAVRIILLVGDSLNLAEPILIDPQESAGQTFGGSRQKGVIEAGFRRHFIAIRTHMCHDLKSKLL